MHFYLSAARKDQIEGCLYLWGKKQSGYKMSFENIALFSLPLNCIFLFQQLEVIILDLGPENCKNKGRISLSLTETLTFNKKKNNINGQA